MKCFQSCLLLAVMAANLLASPLVEVVRSPPQKMSMVERRAMAFNYRDDQLSKKALLDPIEIGRYSLDTKYTGNVYQQYVVSFLPQSRN